MVRNNSKRSIALEVGPVLKICQFSCAFNQRGKQICIKIADLALEDCGEAFEPSPRVNRGLWQGLEMRFETITLDVAQVADAVELHEHQVPDFHVAAAVAAEFAVGVALIGGCGARSEERRVGKECRSRRSPYH